MFVKLAIVAAALLVAHSSVGIADELDDWCARVQKASSLVICSDARLRAETIARQKVFDFLREHLTSGSYKSLLVEQNSWVKAYTARCGVPVDSPPPLPPISRNVVDCYLHESSSRTAELIRRFSWVLPREIATSVTPPPTVAPQRPSHPAVSAVTDVAIEAWYTCLYDAADTLSEQPEPASVVVEAAFGSCSKYKIAYRESIPGLSWEQAEKIAKSIFAPRVLARVMSMRAARAKLHQPTQLDEPKADYSKM